MQKPSIIVLVLKRMFVARRYMVGLFALLLVVPCYANSSIPSPRIKQLLSEGKEQQAYQTAIDAEDSFEGEIEFDLLLGMTSQRVGDWQRAIYAYERVLFTQPNNISARFGLASSYYEMRNFDAAKLEFTRLKNVQLHQEMRTAVDLYLYAIEKQQAKLQQQWTNTVGISSGHDSNPNSGIDEEFLTIPRLGNVLIFEENREYSAWFMDLNATSQYSSPINQSASWQTSAAFKHQRFNQRSAADRWYVLTDIAYTQQFDKITTSIAGYYRTMNLDSAQYFDVTGIHGNASYQIAPKALVGFKGNISSEQYDQQPQLDRKNVLISAYYQSLTAWGAHTFSLSLGRDNADNNQQDLVSRNLSGAAYDWQFYLTEQLRFGLQLSVMNAEYDDINPIFLQLREDTFVRGQLQAEYTLLKNLNVLAQAVYLQNDSDLAIYDYQRNRFSVGVQYEF